MVSGGKSRVYGGNDFAVTLNSTIYGTSTVLQDYQGTIMHELGHTLGLQHGGTDSVNYKPNYYSVMNYTWQFYNSDNRNGTSQNYASSWQLNYSTQQLPSINEAHPPKTLGGDATKSVPFDTRFVESVAGTAPVIPLNGVENPQWRLTPLGGAANFKQPANTSTVKYTGAVDMNADGRIGTLQGASDWDHLLYNFRESPAFEDGQHGAEDADQSTDLPATPETKTLTVVGADAGGTPEVKVYDLDGSLKYDFPAFDAPFQGGVRVAVGDVNGDHVDDIIAAMGSAGGAVRVFDGSNGNQLYEVTPFGPSFTGGVNVAVGNVNGDGSNAIIVAPASGPVTEVKVLDGIDGSDARTIAATATDGVTVAVGDVNGDGTADVIVAPATGRSPLVKVYNGADGSTQKSFRVSDSAFNGAFVAAADVDGDGLADIIVGAGGGSSTRNVGIVKVFSGANPRNVLDRFLATDADFHGGVRVAAVELADGSVDLITGTGPGAGIASWISLDDGISEAFSMSPFGDNRGVFVG